MTCKYAVAVFIWPVEVVILHSIGYVWPAVPPDNDTVTVVLESVIFDPSIVGPGLLVETEADDIVSTGDEV